MEETMDEQEEHKAESTLDGLCGMMIEEHDEEDPEVERVQAE